MMTQEFYATLRCPESGQRLSQADPALVGRINTAIAGGKVQNRSGRLVTEMIDGGLVRGDGAWLYPIRGDLPILLMDEAIAVGK